MNKKVISEKGTVIKDKITTKERIVNESLSLFSIKGFKGTSVKNIAEAVGIKDSSLYKHFKSKQEIMDTIVMEMHKRMENISVSVGLPDDKVINQAANEYSNMSKEELVDLSRKIFLFYLKDDFMARFWRLANMEQYQNEEIYKIFRKIFMEESIIYQTELFAKMVENGTFKLRKPRTIAMNFYMPVFFLLSKYSGMEEKEQEALALLDEQVMEFYENYSSKC